MEFLLYYRDDAFNLNNGKTMIAKDPSTCDITPASYPSSIVTSDWDLINAMYSCNTVATTTVATTTQGEN